MFNPRHKGAKGVEDVDYRVYGRYDLGEFDQKGTVRTKYGTRAEYINTIRQAQTAGLDIYADVVINYMIGVLMS